MKNKIFLIIFMFVWISLIILNFLWAKGTFSEQENRYLARIPKFSFEKLVSGEYQKNMESYINDHFIFRNIWIKIKSQEELMLGKTENNGVYIGKDGYLFEKFIYNEEEQNHVEKVADGINTFADNTSIPIYFILIPNSIYIHKEKLPNNVEVVDQNKIITGFYSKLNKKIKTINVTETITNNKSNYLYFRTDHHMTSDGAYLVYKEFNNAKQIYTQPLEDYNKVIASEKFLGTFDSKAQIINQKPDNIVVYINESNTNIKEAIYDNEVTQSIFNEEYLEKKDKYSYFLNGNNARVIIKTNVENNKKLLIIKDSYAHITAQFLCNDYEEIHFIDPRYYKESLSKYIDENNINEALFLYNVSNIATDLGIGNVR